MSEFRMRAAARYPDGARGEPFAAVSAPGLVRCFVAITMEVLRWLPRALSSREAARPPSAVELTLEWSDAAAATPAPGEPRAPNSPARCDGRLRDRGRLRCLARSGLGGAATLARPARARAGDERRGGHTALGGGAMRTATGTSSRRERER